MNLIKIDPQTRTVERIESTGTLEDMYRLIDCRFIDVCARQDNGDSLTVDDESLDLEPQPEAFSYNGFGPIHGIALLTGIDDEGGTAKPVTSVEEATSQITWLGAIHTQPFIHVFSF